MVLQVPGSITASKVTSFKECGLAFRLSVIDRIPQPQTPWTIRGSLAHAVLERMYFYLEPAQRTRAAALDLVDQIWAEPCTATLIENLRSSNTPSNSYGNLYNDTKSLVLKDFEAENPMEVDAIATELRLEAKLGDTVLRGVIDRLDRNRDGTLTVTDYKTGKIPAQDQENERLTGVYFYALLCEQVLGERPATVQLIYLKDATRIISTPTEQVLRGLTSKTKAVWKAVCNACENDDFRPRPSRLCRFCCYQELCPAQGGSMSLLEDFKLLNKRHLPRMNWTSKVALEPPTSVRL